MWKQDKCREPELHLEYTEAKQDKKRKKKKKITNKHKKIQSKKKPPKEPKKQQLPMLKMFLQFSFRSSQCGSN